MRIILWLNIEGLGFNNKNRYLFMNLWNQMTSICRVGKNLRVTIKYLYFNNILVTF